MIFGVPALSKQTYSKDVESSCVPQPEIGAIVVTHRHRGDDFKKNTLRRLVACMKWQPAKEQLVETHRRVELSCTIRDSVWILRVFYKRKFFYNFASHLSHAYLGVVQFNLFLVHCMRFQISM